LQEEQCSMAKSSIKLTKYTAEYDFNPDQRKGWSLLVRASDAVNMDKEIFVYHRMSGKDAYTGDVFEAITSVNQIYELPKYAPATVDENEVIPYYRRSQMEVYARTLNELEEIWEYVQFDVGRLISELNSSRILHSTSQSKVKGSGDLETTDIENAVALQLNWEPAGSWDGTNIKNPDKNKPGWLPISEFENTIGAPEDIIPQGAIWFYNKYQDTDFKNIYDKKISEPYEANILEVNGVELLYGSEGAFSITKDTVFWLENKNYVVEGIQKNPWPDDYIDGLPLSYLPTIRLIINFK